MDLKIAMPEESALMSPVDQAHASAAALVIDSPEMKAVAASDLRSLQARLAAIEEQRTGIVKPLNDVVKRVNDLFRSPAARLNDAVSIIKGKILAYDREQARIAEEARRRAEEEARKERERAAAAAAAAQAKAEKEARELRERAAAAAAAGREAEAAKLESKADSREEAGAEKAAELTMQANAAVHVAAPPPPPKVAGLSTRKKWKGVVKDKAKFVAFVAANPAFLHLLDVNETALNQFAASTKGAADMAGVTFFEDEILSSRRAT